jgi:single-strand DNA-binding protein
MNRSLNRVTLLGHIGKDPDIRSTLAGKLVANMSIATTESQKDRDGKWQEQTEWHNLVAFGHTAEVARDYVKKGIRLYIEGKLQTRSWDDQTTGEKRYRTEILIDELIFFSTPGGRPLPDGQAPAQTRTHSRTKAEV